ncbi:MAG: polyphosphate kinase 2 [Gammaproteobacteria bacterium]|nr:polyphosphate kinase 2 [Gammaproteobacteria bacterium]MCP5410006.1 polyphosphate kinase 2 [Chromatiaceae bacterium]MCP5443223.1 polyphosphate kinase 2 [Chromatiaceae bacterium]
MAKNAFEPSALDDGVPKAIVEKVLTSSKKRLIGPHYPYEKKLDTVDYERQKVDLQVELLKLQKWVGDTGQRIVMIFEGRDAGGKGGTIKRFMEHMNPRQAHVIALTVPTAREQGQWYFQRYISTLPSKGEMALYDRSWYNRGVVEPVMGFCTPEQHKLFLKQAPIFEKMLTDDGIILYKFWFSVSREEQFRRFKSREFDTLKQWKLSPVDQEGLKRWDEFTDAKNKMFDKTDSDWAPWTVIRSDGKKRARLNCMRFVLNSLPYEGKNKEVAVPPDPKIVGSVKEMYDYT